MNATQNYGGPRRARGDEGLHINFYTDAVQNEFKTAQEGRPIFDDREMIEIRIPLDDKTIIHALVTDEYRNRFPDEYKAFQSNTVLASSGTPLEHWSALTKSHVAMLKNAGVVSVEDLVNASDANIRQVMGGLELKTKAKAFLDAAKDTALVEKQALEINELREAIMALQAESVRVKSEEVATDKKSK